MLYPAAWVGPYNASHLFGLPAVSRAAQPRPHSRPRRPEPSSMSAPTLVSRVDGADRDESADHRLRPSPIAHVLTRMLEVNRLTDVVLRLKACGDMPGRACFRRINSYVGGAVADAAPRGFSILTTLPARPGQVRRYRRRTSNAGRRAGRRGRIKLSRSTVKDSAPDSAWRASCSCRAAADAVHRAASG